MSETSRLLWPSHLNDLVNKLNEEKNFFTLEIESERNQTNEEDYLLYCDDALSFHSQTLGVMSFDFEESMNYHKRQNYALSKEPLAKALGIKGESKPYIWDTTCGTGKDSLLISHFGSKLKAFERNPIVFLLLQDALRRYPVSFTVVFADASTHYKNDERPDVIYYDPMYPEKNKKSALPRKEMRIFKDIVGEDLDSAQFVEWALSKAQERVVVKRPLNAKPVLKNPSASYEGKSTRYDMYKIF